MAWPSQHGRPSKEARAKMIRPVAYQKGGGRATKLAKLSKAGEPRNQPMGRQNPRPPASQH
eukprot:15485177-Alexandrium_andersonii.AAC.1